jgi:hypothetical protein
MNFERKHTPNIEGPGEVESSLKSDYYKRMLFSQFSSFSTYCSFLS